jgi:hypothetical protein
VVGSAVSLIGDQTGQRTAYAPRISGSVTAAYGMGVGGGYRLLMELSPYFTSNYVIQSGDPQVYNAAGYVRLDGRLSLDSRSGSWAVDVIGKNLADRTIVDVPAFGVAPLYTSAKEARRNVAVQFRYKW